MRQQAGHPSTISVLRGIQARTPHLTDAEKTLVVARGRRWGEGGSKVQTSGYKLSSPWTRSRRHLDCGKNTALQSWELLRERILEVLITQKEDCDCVR